MRRERHQLLCVVRECGVKVVHNSRATVAIGTQLAIALSSFIPVLPTKKLHYISTVRLRIKYVPNVQVDNHQS